ncbi:MAG: hypothetical protein IID18_09070 [Nitrospinae bacterium]|nr:hypothetical protein [Nitrospinota bacterium]
MDGNEKRSFVEQGDPTEIFWKKVPDALCEGETLLYVVHSYVSSFRSTIDDQTQTAKSIDKKEPWKQIKENAEKDGLKEFADALAFIDGILIE